MGFNIPMNTTGVMNANSLMNLNNGGGMQNQPSPQPQMAQPTQQPQMAQPQMAQPTQQSQMAQPIQQPQMAQPTPQRRQRPQGGGVHLKKGQRVNLGGNNETLTNIQVCLGWDVNNVAVDLDASAFMLGADNRVLGDDWFVFYGQTNSPDGSITHSGDSNGAGVGDDEIISINLAQVNPNVAKIVFIITIDEALTKGFNFSMVQNAYVRVVDTNTGKELIKFTLEDYYANVTAMVVGEVYNRNGQWKFNAVGDGVSKDLAGLCEMYGVNVVD